MRDKFKNKDGSLTQYSFACGYIQQVEKSDLSCELYLDGVYHVRFFNRGANWSKGFNQGLDSGRHWLSFDNLKQARKVYNKLASRVLSGKDYFDVLAFEQNNLE